MGLGTCALAISMSLGIATAYQHGITLLIKVQNSPGDVCLEGELEGLDEPLLALLERAGGGDERVLHKHGDRHRSDSSRDRGDERRDLGGRLVVDVAHEALARLLGRVWRRDRASVNARE